MQSMFLVTSITRKMANGTASVNKNSANRKTPRFYLDVAELLKVVDGKTTSVKSAIYSTKLRSGPQKVSNVNAAVCNVLKYRDLLDQVIGGTPLAQDPYCDPHLLRFLVSEWLLAGRQIYGTSRPVTQVLLYKADLERSLRRQLRSRGFDCVEDLLADRVKSQLLLPRYVRVNTLLTTVEDVVSSLLQEGYKEVAYSREDVPYEEYIGMVKRLRRHEFLKDIHFEDVIVFHASVNLYTHKLYEEAHVLLQDKASCYPVHFLAPRSGKVVLDACAAPGMKTTHLAAIMQNNGTLLAFDQDKKRVKTLRTILNAAGVECAEVAVQNFTLIDPTKKPFKKVKYILLDPSCSGTGMISDRQKFGDDPLDDISEDRITSLALFQLAMLRHALSFPRVRRVAYSTCSICEDENEAVVSQCLKEFGDRFRLLPPPPSWPVYRCPEDGSEDYSALDGLCVKTVPRRDLVNGFFVAVFQRCK